MSDEIRPDGWVAYPTIGVPTPTYYFMGRGYSEKDIEAKVLRRLLRDTPGVISARSSRECFDRQGWRIRPVKLTFLDEEGK